MTDLNTSPEPEQPDVTEPMPVPEAPQAEDAPASPAERLKAFFNGSDRVRNRVVVGAAAVCVAVACGLGAYSCAGRPATLPAEGGDPVASEASSTLADEVESLIPGLTFQGASVAPDASACEVEAEGGHVMVTETSSAPAENMVDGAARRAAALAGQSKTSPYDVADVTWVATDPEGKVEVAVTVKPTDAAADMAQKEPADGDEAPSTSDILHGSTGWDMTDDAHAGLPEGAGVDKSGGEAPTTPAGSTIVPGEKLPDEPKADEQPAGGDSGSGDQPSDGDAGKSDSAKPSDEGDSKQDSSSAGNSGQSTGGNTSSGSSGSSSSSSSSSSSGSASSSSDSSSSSQPAQRRWVVDRAAYDEPIYETQPVYGQKWVQDSSAYDEKVCVGEAYQFTDGYVTSSDSDAWQHQKQTGASYSVVPQYQTVHHDATGHYETVQTGTKQVQTGTRHHDEVGHWE